MHSGGLLFSFLLLVTIVPDNSLNYLTSSKEKYSRCVMLSHNRKTYSFNIVSLEESPLGGSNDRNSRLDCSLEATKKNVINTEVDNLQEASVSFLLF